MPKKETRRSARVRHDSMLEILDERDVPLGAARLVDVSAVGAGFATTHEFSAGTRLHARLRLLNMGVLDVEGRVVRAEHKANYNLYGLEFESVRDLRGWADASL